MTFVEVTRRTGVTRKALRMYEGLGLVGPVRRTEQGYRLYDEEAVSRLGLIAGAKSLGFTLSEIGELISVSEQRHGQSQQQFAALVQRKLAEIGLQIEALQALRTRLEESLERMERC